MIGSFLALFYKTLQRGLPIVSHNLKAFFSNINKEDKCYLLVRKEQDSNSSGGIRDKMPCIYVID
jgi:hypothetical protein